MTRHPRRIRPSFGIESLEGRTLLSGSSHPSSSMTSQVHDVLVTFRPQSSPQREQGILEWSGAAVIADPASHTYLLAAGPGETLGTLIHRLESRTAVKSVKTVAASNPSVGSRANRQSDVLVTFRPRTTHKREQAILKSSHAAVVAATAPHTYLLAPGPGQGIPSLIHRLKSNSPVKSVRAVAAPNPLAGTVLPVTLPGITIPTPPIVTTPNSATSTASTVGDEIIVQFKTVTQGTTEVFTAAQQQQATALIGSLGASVVASSPATGFYVVAPASGSTPAATLAQLNSSPLVGVARPNYVYSTASGRVDDIGVSFQPGTTDQQVQALTQSLGETIVSPGYGTEIYLVAPAAGTDLVSALIALYASPLVLDAGQNSASSVAAPGVFSTADEIVVQFKTMTQGTTEVFTAAQQQQAAALIGSLGASVFASSPATGFYVVAPASGSTPAATVAQLDASPLVGRAQPNYVYSTASSPSDDVSVLFQPGTTDQQAQGLIKSLGDTIVSPGNGTESYLVTPAAGTDLASALAALYASPLILAASQNFESSYDVHAASSSASSETATSPTFGSTLAQVPLTANEIVVQFKTSLHAETGVVASAPQQQASQSVSEVLTPDMQQQAAALIGSLGGSVAASSPAAGFYVVAPASGSTPAATVAQLDASPLVGRAQPNYVYSTASSPSDDVNLLFQPGTTDQQAQGLIKSLGDTIVSPGNGTESYLVAPAAGTDLASALAALYASPLILAASQNFALSYSAVPNDPFFPSPQPNGQAGQYYMGNIQAPTAWNVTTGSSQTLVAVVDSGITASNLDLQSKIDTADEYNTATNSTNVTDTYGHGTFVAGIIAASTNTPTPTGIAGVDWNARILPLAVSAPGATSPNDQAIVAAVLRAAADGASVINLSLGGSTYDQNLYDAINTAATYNSVVIVAAGNGTPGTNNDHIPSYPADYDLPNEISVEAVDQSGSLASFSNYGRFSVNLAAPGVNILSTELPGSFPRPSSDPNYGYSDGTSFAAPMVSGVAALISGETFGLTATQLATRVKSAITFVPGLDQTSLSGGFIDAAKAVRAQQGGDFDGDGMTDTAFYDPVSAQFKITLSGTFANGQPVSYTVPFGFANDTNIPFAADYNGDGKTDLALYDQTASTFRYQINGTNTPSSFPLGYSNHVSIPVNGDYDGDGKTDFAIYDQTAAQFDIDSSSNGHQSSYSLGIVGNNDIPFAADFNGDGLTDLAVYDPVHAEFIYQINGTNVVNAVSLGVATDHPIPVNGDFDGDGKTDFAVYDPVTAQFDIQYSSTGQRVMISFGDPNNQDTPLNGYFSGNAKTDLAVYDPSLSKVTIQNSRTLQYATGTITYGADNPAPIARTKLI